MAWFALKRLSKSSRSRMRATVRRGHQLEDVLEPHRRQPFAVAPHLELVRILVEHLVGLFLIGHGVGFDRFGGKLRPRLGDPAGIADARRVVADDEHGPVTGILELPELGEHDGVAQMDIRRRGIDAQLHPQLAALFRRRLRASFRARPRAAPRRSLWSAWK